MRGNTRDGVSLLAEAYVLGPNSTTSRLYMVDPNETVRIETAAPYIPGFDYQESYEPTDSRVPRMRRRGRRRFKKAVRHYGKTYTVTKMQVLWGIITVLGLIIFLGSFLFAFYVKLAQLLGVI